MNEYISKTEMLIRLKCLAPKADDWNNCDEYNVAVSQYDYMCDYLKSIEPADVAPVVHGHWITVYREDGTKADKCSVCTGAVKYFDYKYGWCPHCGAKMDESKGEEDEKKR